MTVANARISGTGLITGLPVEVTLEPAAEGHGIVFETGGVRIPAHPDFVVNTDRGVTLGRDGKTLSIVEHFLSACAMMGWSDLLVNIQGAPELPLLDGSAQEWVKRLKQELPAPTASNSQLILHQPVEITDPRNPGIHLHAFPADVLRLTYLVDFPHPDLRQRWLTWNEQTDPPLLEAIAPARTFGFVSELPALQARGMALGVTVENTLGLIEEGGYTSPLRFEDEPVRHKILDLIGDLMLCGVPITELKAHIIVYWGGHAAHLAFGRQLAEHVTRISISQ